MPKRPLCPTCGRPMPEPRKVEQLPGQTDLLDTLDDVRRHAAKTPKKD